MPGVKVAMSSVSLHSPFPSPLYIGSSDVGLELRACRQE